MSDPIPEPVTDATKAPEAPQAPAAATPEPPKPAEPKKSENPWDDPAAAKAEIERLRRENGSDRINAKQEAATKARQELAQEFGKILGLVENEPVDPAKLTEQLTLAQSQARQHALELAIFRATPDASIASALLDSRTFLAKVADLDPSNTEAITAAVGDAVQNLPALGKRSPAPNPAQGASASGPGTAGQLSRAEVEAMNWRDIEKAREEGRLNDVLGIK